jgi:hypothetical protein
MVLKLTHQHHTQGILKLKLFTRIYKLIHPVSNFVIKWQQGRVGRKNIKTKQEIQDKKKQKKRRNNCNSLTKQASGGGVQNVVIQQ